MSEPTSSNNTTTATASATNSSGSSQPTQSVLEVDAQQLKHWASPEELLSIKNLLGDLRLRHASELQQLNNSLEHARSENELLRRDAQAFARLKDAYQASENDFQRMKQERSSWHEEREMLVLKLQQASNEILRLKQEASKHHSSASSSTTSGSRAPSSSSASGSTSTGFSSSSSSSSSSSYAASNLADNKYILALAESEHRRECEVKELQSRFEFQQILHDMARQKMLQRLASTQSDLRVTNEKLAQHKDRVRSLSQQCETAELRFVDLEEAAAKRISESESASRQATEARDQAQRALKLQKIEFDSKFADVQEKYKTRIGQLLEENSAQCSKLTASLTRAVTSASQSDEIFTKEREQLIEELQRTNDLMLQERAKSENDCLQLRQKLQLLGEERDELSARFEDSQTECSRLRTRLDVCSDTIKELRDEVEALHASNQRYQQIENSLTLKTHAVTHAQTERDAALSRAAVAEQQLSTLGSALERERNQGILALEIMQRKREEEEAEIVGQLSRQVEKLQAKYRDAKIRIKQLASWKEANQPPQVDPNTISVTASSAAAAASGGGGSVGKIDALALMRQQFEAASVLAKSAT